MSLDAEVTWALEHAKVELATVRFLLQESIERLNLPTRLPISTSKTETAKGLLKRQGADIKSSIQIKLAKGPFAVKDLELTLVQVSVALDSMTRAERTLGLYQDPTDLHDLLRGLHEVQIQTEYAKTSLLNSPEHAKFPETINTSSDLPPGVCIDVFVQDFELVHTIHTYQDGVKGPVSLETVNVRSPDPSLISVAAKLDAGLNRLEHVYSKLKAISIAI